MKLRELANLKCGVLCNLYLTSSRLCTDMKIVDEEIGLFEVAKTGYADYEVVGFDVKPVKPGILIIVICKENETKLSEAELEALEKFFKVLREAMLKFEESIKNFVNAIEDNKNDKKENK